MPKIGLRQLMAGCALSLAVALPAQAQDTLTVWFTKGFYKSDDDAVLAVVQKFEKATGVKAAVSFYTTEDCVTKSVAARNPCSVAHWR